MSIPMYDATIPQFKRMLANLSNFLTKAEAQSSALQVDGKVFLGARLFPNMYDLTRQVQIACDQVKNGMARLAGMDAPRFEDHESTFEELQERIAKTVAFLESLQPEQINGSESRQISFSIRDHKFEFVGDAYVTTWIIPNFYFHVTTAYNILRHNGVGLGKSDFLA